MSQAESSKKHYEKNKLARIADKKARKRRNRIFVQEYKRSHPCIRCGESTPCCLDFHHVDPSKKIDVLTQMANRGFGIKRILEEIAKCVILCANCHRKEHSGESPNWDGISLAPRNNAGSTPVSSTKFLSGFVGVSPGPGPILRHGPSDTSCDGPMYSRLAQWSEHLSYKQGVKSSSLLLATSLKARSKWTYFQ
jgi:hypothetical protein